MPEPLPSLERTLDLVQRVRENEPGAADQLVRRYEPLLRRWAHGRLPMYARDLADTEDLVQVALTRALQHLDDFHSEREGAFLAYLRNTALNELRDHIRRVGRRPDLSEWNEQSEASAQHPDALPLEDLITYERALDALDDLQREAVVLRIEFGYPFAEIAQALDISSANTARMMVVRALERVAKSMNADSS